MLGFLSTGQPAARCDFNQSVDGLVHSQTAAVKHSFFLLCEEYKSVGLSGTSFYYEIAKSGSDHLRSNQVLLVQPSRGV